MDKVFEMRKVGNKHWHWPSFKNPIDIMDWNNLCFSYNVSKREVKLVHNGMLEVNYTRPLEVQSLEDFIPSSWFGPYSSNKDNPNHSQVNI